MGEPCKTCGHRDNGIDIRKRVHGLTNFSGKLKPPLHFKTREITAPRQEVIEKGWDPFVARVQAAVNEMEPCDVDDWDGLAVHRKYDSATYAVNLFSPCTCGAEKSHVG